VSPFVKLSSDGDAKIGYYFYDLNTKINHIINKKNRIYLSAYLGDDKVWAKDKGESYKSDFGLRWGNVITAFRWNNVVGPRLFSNLTATYSRYRFNVFSKEEEVNNNNGGQQQSLYRTDYYSGIRDWALKLDYDFMPTPAHVIRYGVSGIAHKFSPGAFTYRVEDMPQDTTLGGTRISAGEFSAYIEDDYKFNDKLKVNFGVHASSFVVENKWYHSVQPRISARYLLTPNLSLKASYASMMQYIHLLTNAGLGLPTDLWVPSTSDVKPQRAHQYALGLARNFKSDYEVSLETYYKKMSDLIDYKDGTSFTNVQTDWRDKVVTKGQGESYGAEILAQKKTGKVTGWIGYTLSWTYRQFDDLNNGKWYPYKYDRRHDVSVALVHSWNKRMDFSAVWVYGTGNAITLPTAQYAGAISNSNRYSPFGPYTYNQDLNYYGDRNSSRMRDYHRLDISFSFWKDTKWGRSKWTLACYNVYSRRNPFFMDLTVDTDRNRKFVQYSLFPIIPSINYTFKF
jgi:hypothetical protein